MTAVLGMSPLYHIFLEHASIYEKNLEKSVFYGFDSSSIKQLFINSKCIK